MNGMVGEEKLMCMDDVKSKIINCIVTILISLPLVFLVMSSKFWSCVGSIFMPGSIVYSVLAFMSLGIVLVIVLCDIALVFVTMLLLCQYFLYKDKKSEDSKNE